MPNVNDVASYISKQTGEITAMKLQKLVYYSQAWSLVWDENPLFDEEIQAWANGPVVPSLYAAHKGQFKITEWNQGDSSNLTAEQVETIDSVLNFYGGMNSQVLSDLTHSEEPWRNARIGLAHGERGKSVITHSAMAEYYSSIEI
jgi:uncharacterized phage-associated protein